MIEPYIFPAAGRPHGGAGQQLGATAPGQRYDFPLHPSVVVLRFQDGLRQPADFLGGVGRPVPPVPDYGHEVVLQTFESLGGQFTEPSHGRRQHPDGRRGQPGRLLAEEKQHKDEPGQLILVEGFLQVK